MRKRLAEAAQRGAVREPIPVLVRNTPRHPISKAAWIRQSKGRWYTTHSQINVSLRRFIHSSPVAQAVKYDRASFPTSQTASAVRASPLRAPFASTLRPNLTGGALPRTAGGYSIGGSRAGGARYFSHTPTAPAQVVSNVSAAMRCFLLSGKKAQFDGVNARGEKRFRDVSVLQDKASRKMSGMHKIAPGSFIDFRLNPMLTALSPLTAELQRSADVPSLNTEGFMDVLSVDFARALKDFTAVMNDLKRLQSLGDLAVTSEPGSILRVHFPGCDADTVEALCHEVGVLRGVIGQDPDFGTAYGEETALLFPFASMSEKCLSSPSGSVRSRTGYDMDYEEVEVHDEMLDGVLDNPWLSSSEGYCSLVEDEISESASIFFETPRRSRSVSDDQSASYVEGIYRFIETCDNASRRV